MPPRALARSPDKTRAARRKVHRAAFLEKWKGGDARAAEAAAAHAAELAGLGEEGDGEDGTDADEEFEELGIEPLSSDGGAGCENGQAGPTATVEAVALEPGQSLI